MTLYRRLVFAVTTLVLCLLAINLMITLHNARLNIYEQLQVHAQDTATSLAFSLSHAAVEKDDVLMTVMIDAIFDRGYYRCIMYSSINGTTIIKRELPPAATDVPLWFVNWLLLPEASGKAQVSSGWYQLGEIDVVSHPGFAYQDLWRSFKEQLWLFSVAIVLCYGLLGMGLRVILGPLKKVEAQANAICRKEFAEQETLPSIPELRQVVIAMNRMVVRIKEMFQHHVDLNEQLHQQLNIDAVTGLLNRQEFDRRLASAFTTDRAVASGALILIRIACLQAINMQYGREKGDDYLRDIGGALSTYLRSNYPDHVLSRHAGADFALLVPAVSEYESQELMEKLYTVVHEGEWHYDELQAVYIGTLYISRVMAPNHLMALTDVALSQAQSEQHSGCVWHKVDKHERALSAREWSVLIRKAINDESFHFHFQPVWQWQQGQKVLLFNEVMTRMCVDDIDYSAGTFIPMAARAGVLPLVDMIVIRQLIENLHTVPETICINCSIASIEDAGFMETLEQLLQANAPQASHLIFELSATVLDFAEPSVRQFVATIKQYNAQFSLHHFGQGSSSFACLQTLPVDYLKIDRHFIQNVVKDADARFFIRSFVAIASSCDITILAEGVETEEQWQALIALGLQGGQGYWLGKPSSEQIKQESRLEPE